MRPMTLSSRFPPKKVARPLGVWRSPGLRFVSALMIASASVWAGLKVHAYGNSPRFCGTTCHRAMAPQYATHRVGAHSAVPCVSCHAGAGLIGAARAKARGLSHVWSFLGNQYLTPIQVIDPRHRVSADRCGACHTVQAFARTKTIRANRYGYDEHNTERVLSLQLRMLGTPDGSKDVAGLAWHMSGSAHVTFVSDPSNPNAVASVSVRKPDGRVLTYATENAASARAAGLPERRLECTDCHNRSAHRFQLPDVAVDGALSSGRITAELPSIKRLLVEALSQSYPSRQDAHRTISDRVEAFYRRRDPALFQQQSQALTQTVRVALELYERSAVLAAGIDVGTYPDQLGHRFSAGCFRCHDGRHSSSTGEVLASDCNSLCHSAPMLLETRIRPAMAKADATTTDDETQFYAARTANGSDWHPWQLPSIDPPIPGHERLICSDCHGAGRVPSLVCENCHHASGL